MDKFVQVVTAFLMHEGKVFLIKRSDRVGTYRGYWAGISGYVENLPILQARTELLEETGMRTENLRLRGIGVPLPVDDPEHGSSWMVFPFLFETDHPELIRTDWESSESRWVTPDELKNYQTVPGLVEVLERIWPPFGSDKFWTDLESIATDTTRGATDLAISGLAALSELSQSENIHRAALAFAACRPSMGVFPNIASRTLSAIDAGKSLEETTIVLRQQLEVSTGESALRTAQKLSGAKRILTLSRSRAVFEAILAWVKEADGLEVVVAESRPKMEGLGLAEALSNAGIKVTLIADAQIGHFVPSCDAVLVGCDAISVSGEVVNKAGTKLVVLAARDAGIPAYAVAQTMKIMPLGWPEVVEEQDPRDVYAAKGFRVRNVIFDSTPISYFSAVVAESGDLTDDNLAQYRPPDITKC